MDERIRRYFTLASLVGLLAGALVGFASGGGFGAPVGAGIGFSLAAGSVLYWGEHGGARRGKPAGEVPSVRRDQRLVGTGRVPGQRTGSGRPHLRH
ncbi:hypothetical protein ACPCBC_29460 [Streptomyces incarnatus]|uniref:hypothetical protein n=1 Tax=unclassified Streptomyces TaxID=2593676 RepID=UPI0011A56533|nr:MULTISPECIES: hypothetical protein [Streptomyces]QHC27597.1 hypothetical protein GR129_00725 [Streptomyces sp. HF10]WKE67621.1 hypothetical protein QHG49_00525 [Streptomyces sp. WP-1]